MRRTVIRKHMNNLLSGYGKGVNLNDRHTGVQYKVKTKSRIAY